MGVLQIDSARMTGLNEGVAVCPHAGGVGLCNMVPHLQAWDYIALTGTTEQRVVEWVDHLHHHFTHPPRVEAARYVVPRDAGYSTQFKEEAVSAYSYTDPSL